MSSGDNVQKRYEHPDEFDEEEFEYKVNKLYGRFDVNIENIQIEENSK